MANPALTIFLFTIFAMGLGIVYITIDAQKKLSNECVSPSVNISLNAMLSLGILLLVLPFTQFLCVFRCDCLTRGDTHYKWIFSFIFLLLAFISGYLWNGLSGKCNSPEVVKYARNLCIASSLLTFLIFGYYSGVLGKITQNRGGSHSVSGHSGSGHGGSSSTHVDSSVELFAE